MDEYFNINKNAKNYPKNAWKGSEDVALFAIPSDEGLEFMDMYSAMAFISSNDISSMIAMRIPKEDYIKYFEKEDEDFRFEIKDQWFVDYKGETLL